MMHKMKTRSSRCFFVVLLHLVGVAQWPNVLPFSIGLEELSLSDLAASRVASSRDASTSSSSSSTSNDEDGDPVWLQDSTDQMCLGLMGRFVECGDATLWQVSRLRRKRLRMGLFGIEDTSFDGWRFQIVDDHVDESKRRRVDCLRNKDGSVSVERCSRVFSLLASAWDMKDDGSLQSLHVQNAPLCLMRKNQSATLSSCNDRRQRKVQFTLVRYRTVIVPVASASDASPRQHQGSSPALALLPASEDVANSALLASEATILTNRLMQPLSPSTSSKGTSLGGDRTSKKKATSQNRRPQSLKALHDTNPILFMGAKSQTSSLLVAKLGSASRELGGGAPRTPGPSTLAAPRRMEVHPYIAAAKNEVWVDPQTGLEYYTDLCRYLGRDRKEYGRHTLMGVGQYRKGYVIKVYGVAFYVSKRDALADGSLSPYAGLSADDLRTRPDFYELLRNMHPASVDRTLLLKTNMQLSAEVMRNSLHADWQYLTPEAKSTLIDSSMRPREADAEMLRIIQRADNPSRCSCSQVAPESYQADPSCCARGTELAFTWLKNGSLEVRLNRRLMDSFPRSDIAEGIFYEYLRTDDPISPELRERVVDGFPFLLAPLAQVKGVSMGHQRPSTHRSQGFNPIIRTMLSVADFVTSSMAEASEVAHRSAVDAMNQFGNAARSLSESAMLSGRDLVRRRDLLVRQLAAFPDTVLSFLCSHKDDRASLLTESLSDPVRTQSEPPARRESLGRAFGYPLSRWFSETYRAPDEIGPMKIHPTMTVARKAFLAFVHLYLLLLFIVSFPGSYTTRTKLVVRRSRMTKAIHGETASEAETESTDDKTYASLDSRGTPKAATTELSHGSHDRIKFRNRRLSKRGILRRALGPSVSDDIQDELSSGSSNTRLKKKSLSYFL